MKLSPATVSTHDRHKMEEALDPKAPQKTRLRVQHEISLIFLHCARLLRVSLLAEVAPREIQDAKPLTMEERMGYMWLDVVQAEGQTVHPLRGVDRGLI